MVNVARRRRLALQDALRTHRLNVDEFVHLLILDWSPHNTQHTSATPDAQRAFSRIAARAARKNVHSWAPVIAYKA